MRHAAGDVRGMAVDEGRHRGGVRGNPMPGVLVHRGAEHQYGAEAVEQDQQLRGERILIREDRRVGFGGARGIVRVLPGDLRKAPELPGRGCE